MELGKPNARTKVTMNWYQATVDARAEKGRGGSAKILIQRPEMEVSAGSLGAIVRLPLLRLEVMMDRGDTDWTDADAAFEQAALALGHPETLPAVLVAVVAASYSRGVDDGAAALQREMKRLILTQSGRGLGAAERETALLSSVVRAWWRDPQKGPTDEADK